ncbi:integral membrane protein-like protein [Westerdykella ornata]|uniref:Integral membrane protein-like protein n=1 Tax=Westerdykella ornata TaxID=318751 RepID=A0A6A6JEB6_WESOR|nr:integral membrane protein-like protein [Westerdykella ornata]KAF2274513.1 integral membrane protein-like protein [Westerdykella ornata]
MKLSPFASSCLLALLIDCCSNIIAQRLKAYKLDVPFVFDRVLFFQFLVMGAIGGPVNFHWQSWLERTFPGWKTVGRKREFTTLDTEEKGVSLAIQYEGSPGPGLHTYKEEVRVRNWWNIFCKWFTDCITMGALLNTTLFLVVMGVLKGKPWPQIGFDLRTEMWPIIWDSYKVWPVANFFSTTYCPVERRIVFLSCCGLLWNIYLSLVAARL